MLSKIYRIGSWGVVLSANLLMAEELPFLSPFRSFDCIVNQVSVREAFPAPSMMFRPKSDGYLPWEMSDRKIWINADLQLALQVSQREEKGVLEVDLMLRNLCFPESYFAGGRLRLESGNKVHEMSRQILGIHPIRLEGNLFVDAFQGTEILGFLRYIPAVKSLDGDPAKTESAKFFLAIHAYNGLRKAYDIIDIFQLSELKELER